jgi:hypothetical protein
MNHWSKQGVLDRVFEQLQQSQVVRIRIEAVSLDSTIIKVHPDGTGAPKGTARRSSASPEVAGPPRSPAAGRVRADRAAEAHLARSAGTGFAQLARLGRPLLQRFAPE